MRVSLVAGMSSRYRLPVDITPGTGPRVCKFKGCGRRVHKLERHSLTHLPRLFESTSPASWFRYLLLLCQVLGVPGDPTGLLRHVVAAGYRETSALLKASEVEFLLEVQGYICMSFPDLEVPNTVSINPPNCEAAVLHWRIQVLVMNSLTDSDCHRLSCFEPGQKRQRSPSPVPGLESPEQFVDCHFHLDMMLEGIGVNCYGEDSLTRALDNYPTIPALRGFALQFAVACFCFPSRFPSGSDRWNLLRDQRLRFAVGLHPKAADVNDGVLEDVRLMLDAAGVVALGEIGLDYSSSRNPSKLQQQGVLRRLLLFVRDRRLPVILHCRGPGAAKDCLEIMKTVLWQRHRVYRHCFLGDFAELTEWLEAFPNSYFGLTGTAPAVREDRARVVRHLIDIRRLLLETDSPFLCLGQRRKNTPHNIPEVARVIGAEVDMATYDVIRAARCASLELFGLQG